MDPYLVANFVMSFIIILINTTIFVVFTFGGLLEKPSNRLLQSLAIGDLLSGVAVLWHCILQQRATETWEDQSFAVRLAADLFTTFAVEAVILHLCIITLDRALSLFQALRYRDLVTKKPMVKVIVGIWVVPFLTSIIQLAYLYPLFDGKHLAPEEEEKIAKCEMGYSVASFLLFMFIPSILMGGGFIMMFAEIRKLLLRTPSATRIVSQQQRRVILIFSLMYGVFLFLGMPYFTLRLYLDIQVYRQVDVFYIGSKTLGNLYILKTLTSLFNPLLYSLMNREFRVAVSLLLRKTRHGVTSTILQISSAPVITLRHRDSDSGFRETEILDQSSIV